MEKFCPYVPICSGSHSLAIGIDFHDECNDVIGYLSLAPKNVVCNFKICSGRNECLTLVVMVFFTCDLLVAKVVELGSVWRGTFYWNI